MKIVLSAFIGSHNLGDEAIAEVLIDWLEQLVDSEITVLSINPAKTQKFAKHPSTKIRQAGFLNFARELRHSDCLVLGGGGIIQDESSVINIIYYYLQMVVARRILRKPVFWAFVGVGPIKTKLGSRLLKRMRKLAQHVLVRDNESAQLLQAHGFSVSQISVAYDLVFNFPVSSKRMEADPEKYILFCPRDWFFVATITPTKYALRRARRNPQSRLQTYRTQLLKLVEKCLHDNPELKIVGVAFFYSQDLDLLLWIRQHLTPSYADRYVVEQNELLTTEFLGLAQKSTAILGVRLHSLILGAVAGRPLVPLVYSAKVRNLVNYLQLGAFTTLLDKPDFAVDQVAKNVQKVVMQPTSQAADMLTGVRLENVRAFDELVQHMQAAVSLQSNI